MTKLPILRSLFAVLTAITLTLSLSAASDTTIQAGNPVTLSLVVGTGTPPYSYIWSKDGAAISGATAATYSITSFAAANVGVYQATISNIAGSTLSDTVKLILQTLAPVITTQPVGQTKKVGDSVSISVAATGSPAPTYQWYRNGVALAGFTTNTFTDPLLDTSDTGSYTVVVTNSAGSVTSNAAILTVVAPPAGATLKVTVGS